MLPILAFVPEQDVVDCFNNILQDFPASALNVAKYFEDTYIEKLLPDQSKFPIRIWNMYEMVQGELARTNNAVEGWPMHSKPA